MTTIAFRRSGGMDEWGTEFALDLDRLTSQEADHLLLLVDKARFFHIQSRDVERPDADEFIYTITVDTGLKHHSVRFSDTTIPEPLRPLFEELSTLAIVV